MALSEKLLIFVSCRLNRYLILKSIFIVDKWLNLHYNHCSSYLMEKEKSLTMLSEHDGLSVAHWDGDFF